MQKKSPQNPRKIPAKKCGEMIFAYKLIPAVPAREICPQNAANSPHGSAIAGWPHVGENKPARMGVMA